MAIASATLRYVATTLRCACLFVTHHPQVAALSRELPHAVAARYMAYAQHPGGGDAAGAAVGARATEGAPSSAHVDAVESITFLYRAVPGIAPASYGLNVARMAQLPPAVLERAAQVVAQQRGEAVKQALCSAVAGVRRMLHDGEGVSSQEINQALREARRRARLVLEM